MTGCCDRRLLLRMAEMHFFDTHVHFDDMDEAAMLRARDKGVLRVLAVGGDPRADAAALDAANRWPAVAGVVLGRDRDQACTGPAGELVQALERGIREQKASGTRVVGIGEIGLDYHYHPDTAEAQKRLLARQLELAAVLDLPVVAHSREADVDTVEILGQFSSPRRRGEGNAGVVHSFTGGPDQAMRIVNLGFCIGFSGIVTFKNADLLRKVAQVVPEDRLLVETDTPFLAPVPCRGQRNEPAFVVHVAEMLAEVRQCSLEHLAASTWRNAGRLFGLPESV